MNVWKRIDPVIPIDLDGRRRRSVGGGNSPKVETPEFVGMIRRCIRAAGRRVAAGDVCCLTDLAAVRDAVDDAVTESVASLRAEPWCYSWADIGEALGITRQAAQQRFGGG